MTDESGKHSTNETEQSHPCPKEKREQIRKMTLLCSSITVPSGNQLHRWNYHVMPRGINR